jgi:hypothetical protein
MLSQTSILTAIVSKFNSSVILIGMDTLQAVANRFAVLIGINFYAERPLRGCVQDVKSIKQYLEAKSTPVDIEIFTASAPSDPNCSRPSEEPDLWPTFENVTCCLERIASAANPGDFVYVHYSGHGTRTEPSSKYSNKNTGDLALVLLDGTNVNGIRYLRGLELAYLLNNMVEKGLKVTLVLDCCFSGSVVRIKDPHITGLRNLDYDPIVDAAYPQNLQKSLAHQNSCSDLRNASLLPNWLVNPNGYTILTACGPHETAKELDVDGQKYGALSYFLLRTLTRLGNISARHQHIYHRLCAKFHESWPRQNPMFYGNKDLSFFGKLNPNLDIISIPVVRTSENSLCLRAGQAHGVSKDDKYVVYPFESPEGIQGAAKNHSIVVRVTTARGLTSDLVGDDGMSVPSHVETGWKARPLTHFSLQKVSVKLMANIDNRDRWLEAAKQRHSLNLSTVDVDAQPFLFSVTLNNHNEYEIQNESYERIVSLPTVPLDQQGGAIDSIMNMLEHLARFKQIEAIENRIPTPSFEESFSVELSHSSGETSDTTGVLEVKHNDHIELMVRNNSDKPLYLHIYDMGPSWQIENLLYGEYEVVLPKNDKKGFSGESKKKMSMTVPDSLRNKGQYQCEDIIKVFITSMPTSFTRLVLDRIPASQEDLAKPVRGDPNRLPGFLSDLAMTTFRGGVGAEEWASQNFVIRTVAEDTGA